MVSVFLSAADPALPAAVLVAAAVVAVAFFQTLFAAVRLHLNNRNFFNPDRRLFGPAASI